mmetsp:Transcript_14018/g.23876  ORF Transcript_14018/g.23876 Transcript_14018/m.23876 type:complete len:85 (+) Transcript_14018:364-618(+)
MKKEEKKNVFVCYLCTGWIETLLEGSMIFRRSLNRCGERSLNQMRLQSLILSASFPSIHGYPSKNRKMNDHFLSISTTTDDSPD